MTVRKHIENALAFLRGELLRVISAKGPTVQARVVFGGVAPVPGLFRIGG